MDSLLTVLDRAPSLTAEEQLEIINQQWVFTHAPERFREKAVLRINSLLDRGHVDARTLMETIRDITRELQVAIEARAAEARVVGWS